MHRAIFLASALTSLLALGAAPAAAFDEEASAAGYELGAFGGWHWFSPNSELGVTEPQRTATSDRPRDGLLGGLRFSYTPVSWVAPELELAGSFRPASGERLSTTVLTGRVQGLLQPFAFGRVRPFVLAGLSWHGLLADGDGYESLGNDVDFGSHYGVGAKIAVSDAFSVRVDGRVYLTPTVGRNPYSMDYEAQAGVQWRFGGPAPRDTDGDGIFDRDDACPRIKGVPSDDPAEHGCPELDTDGDGILDKVDACPAERGVAHEDPARHGCPEVDSDGDGILDPDDACPAEWGLASQDPQKHGCPLRDTDGDGIFDDDDACPDVAGVASADPNWHGCPPPDQDKDGIPDEVDACPLEPGVASRKPAFHGCPERDTDDDGILDADDACPTVKGVASTNPAFHGCPAKEKVLVAVTKEKIEILDRIYFATNLAVIEKRSFPVLDQVARTVLAYPDDIKVVRVEGHTDDVGTREANQELSQRRAESVREYLVSKGVPEKQLEAVGYGLDQPVEAGRSAKARAANRRVEFKIVQ